MKKSIKYAGIAAATLLAVAPVATPSLVNADQTDTSDLKDNAKTADAKALSESVNAFNGKFNGSVEANELLNKQADNIDNFVFNTSDIDYTTFMSSPTAKVIANETGDKVEAGSVFNSNNDTINADTLLAAKNEASQTAAKGANLTVTSVTGTANLAAGTRSINNASELKADLKDSTVKSISLTVNYKYFKDNTSPATTASVTKTINNTDMALSEMNVSFATPYNVALNQTVTDSQLIDGSDVKVTDQDGEAIAVSQVTPSTVYFTSARAASTNDTTGKVGSDVVESSTDANNTTQTATPKFKKAGSYYQGLKLTFADGSAAAKFLAAAKANPNENPLKINGVEFGDINTDNYTVDTTNNAITFARKIVVSSDSSNWTVSSVKGQVHASGDVTLVNDQNQIVKNRALRANTDWITDKVRTNQNGVKQYRVATGEWADANDVKFSEKGDSTDNGSALTDIQSAKGTVSLAQGNYVYMLFTKEGTQVKGRQLLGGTDWKYINTAKDSDGNTYYRVATNEWLIAGNGVSLH